MAFDTLLQATWATYLDLTNPEIYNDRQALNDTMVAEGKIAPTWELITAPNADPAVIHRGCLDVTAANEWITSMNTICSNHGVPAPAFEIL